MSDDFESLMRQRTSTFMPARQMGKGLALAKVAADALRRGDSVYLVTPDHGVERVVSVPGFPDGKQLPDG